MINNYMNINKFIDRFYYNFPNEFYDLQLFCLVWEILWDVYSFVSFKNFACINKYKVNSIRNYISILKSRVINTQQLTYCL